ncbi:hypothetical protein M9H77_35244 [Catharanthus roseus]|uniref:Uncharacterized protein n=1 Tax=Catharanthus roseus TaxID=4058 RepID=A0ACB9ZPD6_CATRO|nr:hypothetical protein M9H77_35244 [Catharanthus roseus]
MMDSAIKLKLVLPIVDVMEEGVDIAPTVEENLPGERNTEDELMDDFAMNAFQVKSLYNENMNIANEAARRFANMGASHREMLEKLRKINNNSSTEYGRIPWYGLSRKESQSRYRFSLVATPKLHGAFRFHCPNPPQAQVKEKNVCETTDGECWFLELAFLMLTSTITELFRDMYETNPDIVFPKALRVYYKEAVCLEFLWNMRKRLETKRLGQNLRDLLPLEKTMNLSKKTKRLQRKTKILEAIIRILKRMIKKEVRWMNIRKSASGSMQSIY